MKMRSKEKIILLSALAGVVALALWGFYLWLSIGPEKAIERELAKIRAKGEPVTLEELAPPEIPDAENAALIYEQAFAVYYKPGRDEEIKLGEIAAKDPAEWTEEDTAAVREYVEKNEDSLPLIFEAANYAKCRFPLDYSQGYMMLLPHFSKMREFTRFLTRNALLKAEEGRIDEALESCWAGFRLGNALMDEPILISQLVRYAIDGMVLWALEEVLSEGDASPEILRRLLEELDIEESRAGFTRCMQGERCFQIDIYEKVIEDPAFLAALLAQSTQMSGSGPGPLGSSKAYGIIFRMATPLLRRDEIFALSVMQRMIEAARLPYHQAKADLAKIEKDLDNAPFYRILSKMLIPALTRSHLSEARHEARIGLAQLALALKIFKAEEGEYPDALAELVPDILPQLPQDPFTGKDFIYKKEGKGFLIYSLGENTKDEGGKWDEKKTYQHDIPWRCKR